MAYTSFFRDPDALESIIDVALPFLSHKKEVCVWDAGCATGEEPYTLAMLFASNMGPFLFNNLDILATDHEESNFPQFENHIKKALYSRKDIFWVPDVFRKANFIETDDPETFCLTQGIRDKVRYIRHDLLSYVAPEKHKSLIVCKNVLMHFAPDQQVKVLEMFHESLDINGFLVLDGAQRLPENALNFIQAHEAQRAHLPKDRYVNMRIIPLHRDSDTDYSCIVYWVLGDMNASGDRNTLIDTGSTSLANLGYFMREMSPQSKGIGKMAIEQIILTHDHYDHAGGLPGIVRQFNPVIYSWNNVPEKYEKVYDGMHVTVGDENAVILHTPGHSDDSVCVYLTEKRILFSGDTIFRISDNKGTYSKAYEITLERLSSLNVKVIFPGHGNAITEDASGFIKNCLHHVKASQSGTQ